LKLVAQSPTKLFLPSYNYKNVHKENHIRNILYKDLNVRFRTKSTFKISYRFLQ
jgi:NADPH-dependent 7-cyano-7-deazaguanine reductase QueF-like protein